MIKKRFYFVRHGRTDWNDRQLCQGQVDVPLNEAGRLEAARLAEFLKPVIFSDIYCSPLIRALETATIIQQGIPDRSLHVLDGLKERWWGKCEGSSNRDMYRIEELEDFEPEVALKMGVEPKNTFKYRVQQALDLALKNSELPLFVSHGRVFLVLCEILNLPPIKQIPNTSLVECKFSDGFWDLSIIEN